MEAYRKLRREENKVHRGKKRARERARLGEIEQLQQGHNIRRYYQSINESRKTFEPRCIACKDKKRMLLTYKQKTLGEMDTAWELLRII